jgi:toxin ParE1/3/4
VPRYTVAPKAQDDLDDIWDTIARDDIEAATRMLAAIRQRFPRLADFPELGRASDYLPGLRRMVVRPYIIFYRSLERRGEDGVQIVRVLHGARNLGAALRNGDR